MHGLAHITGGGVLNLLRLGNGVGYEIAEPLPVPPVFELIARCGAVEPAEMQKVFNMGCGFVAIVPAESADAAIALLDAHHPGTAPIGTRHRRCRPSRAADARARGRRPGLARA